jgi:hypothetical protein
MEGVQKRAPRTSTGFYLPARVKKAAARRAADDGRTLSDVIRRALVRDLVESGYLPPARRELPGRQPEAS